MSRRVPAPLILCVLIGSVGSTAPGETILEDNFPGYAEATWDYSWNVGVGSTTFDANSPGFAHLNQNGPAGGGTYHNAEIISRSALYRVPPYCDFEVRLRNSNNNGFDSPGGPNDPDPNYGIGSRGWGFWNASMDPGSDPVNWIWFSSISPQSDPIFRGRRLWFVRENIPIVVQELGVDLTEWHTYRVKWRQDTLAAYVDDMQTPIAEVTNPAQIPNEGLTFTIWVDNYVVTGDFSDPQIGFLPVPDIQQFIDVDYVKIYTPEYTLTINYVKGSAAIVRVEPNLPLYPEGTDVTLTAEPNAGKSLKHWKVWDPYHPGDANYVVKDTNNPLTLVMNEDRKVTAVFKCGGGGLGLATLVVALTALTLRRLRPQ